jgi:tetratricopeptide (TPR) repeat protein
MTHNKKLYFTLITLLNLLFLISFNANSTELDSKARACTQALDKGDIEAALLLAEGVVKQAPKHREGLLCKGRALGAKGNYAESLTALEMAETQAQPGLEKIISYLLIGNLHLENKKYTDAIASYEKSLAICETDKNDKFKLINHNLIGEAQAQNNDLNAALASYLAGSKLTKNDNERADSYERLGATYSALGQHDSAIEYQLKATLMQQKSGTLDQYANASLALGDIFAKAKDVAGAENTYTKLIQFAKENGGVYYEAKASFELAKLKANNGQTDTANALFGEAYSLADKAGEQELVKEIQSSRLQQKK